MAAVQLINPDSFWYGEQGLLIMWRRVSRYSLALNKETQLASLVLARHADIDNQLYVIKNRMINLSENKHILDQVLDEYEILDDGWRGIIQLSDGEVVKWCLLAGS